MTIETHSVDDGARLPLRTVLVSILGLWACYFILITARASVIGLDFQFDIVWRRVAVTFAAAAVTFVLWLLLRLFDRRSLTLQIAGALVLAMPAALLIALTNQVAFEDLQEKFESKMAEERGFKLRRDEAGNVIIEAPTLSNPDMDGALGNSTPATAQVVLPGEQKFDKWLQLIETGIDRYFLLLAWAALYFALLAGAKAQEAERREERFRFAAKAAELRSLRYQVNPHFLFNTLNSLSALVMTGKAERAEQMIQTISNFYRHSLAEDPTGEVSLEDEFELQEHYLAIESVRFPDRLRVRVALPADLAGCRVPGMILQPLVENSVKYGVSASNRPVTIAIEAREDFGRLVLTVSDNGPGMGKKGFGIGLANVRDRLEARFGDEASIVSGPSPDGYRTELRLPLLKHGA